MNFYDLALATTSITALAIVLWRTTRFRAIKREDRRRFLCFWLWPLALFTLWNAIPLWIANSRLFLVAEITLTLGLLVDFAYYFAIKAPERGRRQALAGLGLVPVLALTFRGYWLPAATAPAVVPHYGEALVWTDRPFLPKTYYFIHPDTRKTAAATARYDDPNYGKAVFAPIDGLAAGVDEHGMLAIENREDDGVLRVTTGPLIPASVNLPPGAPIAKGQPIGLLAAAPPDSPPGIRVTVIEGEPLRFAEVFTGRHIGWRQARALPKRNHRIASDAANRFRLSPDDP